ncbi:MAG: hypothetical protein ACYTFX_04565, partial [Planctomycetota bacterium]
WNSWGSSANPARNPLKNSPPRQLTVTKAAVKVAFFVVLTNRRECDKFNFDNGVLRETIFSN